MEQMDLKKFYKEIRCADASELFGKIRALSGQNFLLESKDVSHIYGRLSLIGVDPVLEISGKDAEFSITALNGRAVDYLVQISDDDLKICDSFERSAEMIRGTISKEIGDFDETQRTKQKNISQIIRLMLAKFHQDDRGFLGLYGAFSYDFIRLFEDIHSVLKDEGVDDFRLCLYDSFIFFDHLKDRAEIIVYRDDDDAAEESIDRIFEALDEEEKDNQFSVSEGKFDLDKREYKGLVEQARELARQGELFEVVYSNTLRADFKGDPYGLYKLYREANPSPYLFYFDFGDEQLIGASPEMMVRCEGGMVHMRPISGTAKRGEDPIEDHENMLKLLQSEKERAELDMLIDLGRNDLARICEPGVCVSDYRFVEKYSKVMHTVAHVSGRLRSDFTALDALIACMNAGTLTGAPKVAAMIEIEKNEKSRRGYYGGAVGYLSFSGEMDTGIIIRTAHIKGGRLSFRVGATLLYDSDAEAEYEETMNKAGAFLTILKK